MTGELDALLAEQIAYYSALAPEYLDEAGVDGVDPGTLGQASRAIEAALATAAPLGEVLELACGPGSFTPLLAKHATALTAVDASSEMLALAAERTQGLTVRFARTDLFRWTPERRYDFIFFGFWLSHVPPERFATFWAAVADALAAGGRVMFVDDGHRTQDELVGGATSTTIERRLRDGRRFRAIKVPLEPRTVQSALRELGWAIEVRPLPGPFFVGIGARAQPGRTAPG